MIILFDILCILLVGFVLWGFIRGWPWVPIVGAIVTALAILCIGTFYIVPNTISWASNQIAALTSPTDPGNTKNPVDPNEPANPPMVITATPMSDIGVLLNKLPKSEVSGLIDWDHLLKMPEWVEKPGLVAHQVLYVQSGVPNKVELPLLGEEKVFEVPNGTVLIFGANSALLEIGDKRYDGFEGFYAAVSEGTSIRSLTVKDGFILLVGRDSAKAEFCARIAQAVEQRWALSHAYHIAEWGDKPCGDGVFSVPLDDDRPPVVP